MRENYRKRYETNTKEFGYNLGLSKFNLTVNILGVSQNVCLLVIVRNDGII